jgi:hypothetical protein
VHGFSPPLVKQNITYLTKKTAGSDRKGAEREYELAGRSKWVKVSRDSTLADLVKIEDHIVGGFPGTQLTCVTSTKVQILTHLRSSTACCGREQRF